MMSGGERGRGWREVKGVEVKGWRMAGGERGRGERCGEWREVKEVEVKWV